MLLRYGDQILLPKVADLIESRLYQAYRSLGERMPIVHGLFHQRRCRSVLTVQNGLAILFSLGQRRQAVFPVSDRSRVLHQGQACRIQNGRNFQSVVGRQIVAEEGRQQIEGSAKVGGGHSPADQHILQPQRVLRENHRVIAQQCAFEIVEMMEDVLTAGTPAVFAKPLQFVGMTGIDGLGGKIRAQFAPLRQADRHSLHWRLRPGTASGCVQD